MSDPLRILLIDDNPDDRLLVIRELRREFPDLQVEQIIEAEGFAQALEVGDFDLVITDYQLRWTDGLAVLHASKARCPDCPVILFTSTGSEEIAVEAMKAGLDDYILKSPKHFVRLPAAVRLALKRAEDSIERVRAEESLRRLERAVEQSIDGIAVADLDGNIQFVNPAWAQMHDYSAEELLGKHLSIFHTEEQLREDVIPFNERVMEVGAHQGEVGHVRKDGTTFPTWMTTTLLKDGKGNPIGLVGIAHDITERKRAEESLRESEERYRDLYENAPNAYFAVGADGLIRRCNRRAEELLGCAVEELVGRPVFELYADTPQGKGKASKIFQRFRAGETVTDEELQMQKADGTPVWISLTANVVRDAQGQVVESRSMVVDITERKRAEEEIRRLNQFLDSVIDNANVWLDVLDEKANVVIWNRASEEISGYSREEVVGHSKICEWLYPDEEYRNEITSEAAAIIEKGAVVEDFETIIRPKDGQIRIISWNSRNLLDEKGNPIGSIALGRDITERRRAEEELQRSFEKLQRALEGTAHVLVSAIEMRDPYTAGHQRRVTQLACAIASEMGLPQVQIEGLRMAGLIHDLGKITIPAEILSKPSRLSDIEWGLIRAHTQAGYDVLKTVDFPWPVAEIVLEHHERLDGSGYPQGLSGEGILMKARILAVADVVEAMASHRPYRPARGLDKALEEISQNRGILYDPEVVDVCLKLFSEKGFEFE